MPSTDAAKPRYTEDDRLAALAAYAILDTESEPEFDDIVAMAARACDVPIAYINLLDGRRQWFKAEIGAGCRELPAKPAICIYAFAEDEILTIPDIAADPRFADAHFTLGGAELRFYAGVALRTPDGLPIGTLCVADHRPRRLAEQQIFILRALARTIMVQLELRKTVAERDRALADRQAAESGRDAERVRLQAVLDSAPVGIVFAEASGRIVGVNPEAERIFRHALPATESVDRGGDWVLYAPNGERLPTERYPLLRALAQGETSAGEEYLYHRGDDTLGWIQMTAAPIRDANGRITGGVVSVDDIGARKSAEAALRRLNETLEATVAERTRELDRAWRYARDLICVIRFDGSFLRLNPAWTATLGWVVDEMVDRPFMEFIHPDDRERTAAAMEGLTRGDSVTSFENRYLDRDGGHRWFSWNAVPHEGLIYSVVRDVTLEKESAAALAKAEEQLRQSQKMEAVGQLTGGIAHDFNNLLTGITAALDMMARRIGQGRMADVERYTRVALASAARAAALTHRLLAFSRRQPLDPRAIDANELVRSIEDLLRRTIGEAIMLDVALAPHLPAILCDPHQLENAVINLVINARDAMPDGGGVTIETAEASREEVAAETGDDAAPAVMRLTVRDTGCGMPPDVMERAFDPFFTTKPIGQGTGLGLSMIYGFIKQSNGYVRIESAVGRGTAVSLYLPRAEDGPSDMPAPAEGVAMRAVAGETVLVVEDERAVRELVVDVLADLGYRAIEAADGPEAVRLIQSAERIDLLVTDVGLPGMNGRQLADQARSLRPGLKVLFITGYAEDAIFGDGSGTLDPGLQMLTKPFSIDALAARLRDMIG